MFIGIWVFCVRVFVCHVRNHIFLSFPFFFALVMRRLQRCFQQAGTIQDLSINTHSFILLCIHSESYLWKAVTFGCGYFSARSEAFTGSWRIVLSWEAVSLHYVLAKIEWPDWGFHWIYKRHNFLERELIFVDLKKHIKAIWSLSCGELWKSPPPSRCHLYISRRQVNFKGNTWRSENKV